MFVVGKVQVARGRGGAQALHVGRRRPRAASLRRLPSAAQGVTVEQLTGAPILPPS